MSRNTTLRDLLLSDNPVDTLWAMFRAGTIHEVESALARLDMEIPDGYRHKNNLAHSIRVLSNAIAREQDGPDLILRTAALLHDIGKPNTRKFEARGKVTFANHEHVGAHMVRDILPKHGYTKAEIRDISRIVRLHMRSHGYGEAEWTDSAVRRLLADAGSQRVMDRLIVVFYADVTTKNDRKLARIHRALDRLVSALRDVYSRDQRAALRPAVNGHEVMDHLGLKPGKELGAVMKFLNSDEGIQLNREDALKAAARIVNQ